MIYLNTFDSHASYEEKLNGGGVDFKIPNVSYCKDANDVHFNPYNLIKFYVGEITDEPQTVSIYTDTTNHLDITVSEGNKWYTYVLPKNKELFKIEGDSVTRVTVKADITTSSSIIIPQSTVEASFKGSNTSKVTKMDRMFYYCTSLTSLDVSSFNTSNVINMSNMFGSCTSLTTLDLRKWDTSNVINMESMFNYCAILESLDLSGWDTSNVTNMISMFSDCAALKEIKMIGCSKKTIDKIKAQLTTDGIINNVTIVTE